MQPVNCFIEYRFKTKRSILGFPQNLMLSNKTKKNLTGSSPSQVLGG
ncbi:MAG: hypothetical protein K0R67_1698 [Paenibacillus sp.]|nr:hypothetical protein [Paenibacillus sp.]